jgi:hypothetical protein
MKYCLLLIASAEQAREITCDGMPGAGCRFFPLRIDLFLSFRRWQNIHTKCLPCLCELIFFFSQSASYLTVFFSHNKSANSTFSHVRSEQSSYPYSYLFCPASVGVSSGSAAIPLYGKAFGDLSGCPTSQTP